MVRFASKFVAVFCVLFFTAVSAWADPLPAPSYWKNQRGSELQIWSVTNGVISGQFTNNAPDYACRGISYPATGRETPTALFFVVTFAQCNSITVWHGQVRGSKITTKWQMLYITPTGSPAIMPGTDVFERIY